MRLRRAALAGPEVTGAIAWPAVLIAVAAHAATWLVIALFAIGFSGQVVEVTGKLRQRHRRAQADHDEHQKDAACDHVSS